MALSIIALAAVLGACAATPSVTSDPEGARISVNGEPRGVTPTVVTVPDIMGPGSAYAVRAEKEGYRPETQVFVERGLQDANGAIPSTIHFVLAPNKVSSAVSSPGGTELRAPRPAAAAAVDAQEEEAFRRASSDNTAAAFEAFLVQYPGSALRPRALAAMAALLKAEGNAPKAVRAFVRAYPDGAACVPIDNCLDLVGPSGATVQDIINAKKDGMSDGVIISRIRNSKGAYKDFSFDEIKLLHRKALSDDVIEAMVGSTVNAGKKVR